MKPGNLMMLENNFQRIWKSWPAWPGTELIFFHPLDASLVLVLEIIAPTINTNCGVKILLSSGKIGFVSCRRLKEIK